MPRRSSREPAAVFINIPYDARFERLYLAYIAGVSAFGLVPRATLEIPDGTARLERIMELIRSCEYSIHDMCRVELDYTMPRTPRFNMPFELGLAIGWCRFRRNEHKWFVFESQKYRLAKSLSDLNGTDPHVHGGTVDGVLAKLNNVLVREKRQPTIAEMRLIYRQIRKKVPAILKDSGAATLYEARPFRDLCVLASAVADSIVNPPARSLP